MINTALKNAALTQFVKDCCVLLCLLGAVTAISFLLDPYVSLTSLCMLYVLAVVLASYRLSRALAVCAAFAAVLALNFFFVPPRWTFPVERSEHFIALLTMLENAWHWSELLARRVGC
jgi:two-component system sensor histidine kinase KdpD